MQLAAMLYVRNQGVVYCAKFHHHNQQRCIFNCRFPDLLALERAGEDAQQQTKTPNETSVAK
jgi:hypothetical protein